VSLPLEAAPSATPERPGLDGWFAALGDEYVGRVPADSLRPGIVDGWRLRWRGRELDVQVDADFPFSAARVYLAGYSRVQAQPHIEKDGKLCLGSKAVPGDRVRTVQAALAEAFRLLTENETKLHDDDFVEDFSLYWLNWANKPGVRVEIMPGPEGAGKTILGRAALTEGRVFVFPGKAAAGKFWTNLTGAVPKYLKETPVISIDPLPAPDRYPESADELWALVEARSQGGPELLARLMANAPKEAFVVLSGKSPSGREHYAAIYLHRPLDRGGQPLKRRVMRMGIEKSESSARTLFGRFKLDRVATQRMDTSSSRLPDGVQRKLADANIIIVGCGALGSGVARMLAQSGVEQLRLVDPENLGWENIRRHELGGSAVGHGKAKTLATSIRAALPMIGFVEAYQTTFASFAREHPEALKQADLIISCTGDWTADASVEHALRQPGHKALAIFGWMEAHALASHAVFLDNAGARLADGFDETGSFRLPVVAGGKPAPPECGGASTPFGAIELSHAQALVARLAMDALRELETAPAWHTWIADTDAFEDAGASIASGWAAARGQPGKMGGLFIADWSFP
jgi:predicted dinucleotide-binding enzyme